MKIRGRFKSDGAFIAEGEENFNPELLAEQLVDVSIEVVPEADTNSQKLAETISKIQEVPFEVALSALLTYGKCSLELKLKA